MNLKLREIMLNDLEYYFELNHPDKSFHNFNGPYFKKQTEAELKKYIEKLKEKLLNGETNVLKSKKLIVNMDTDELIGEVNWYWKSEETLWMEIGIVIFNEDYWGKGIGFEAMNIWINELFKENKNIVRLGLSTWSGNKAMMALAMKLGFKKEAVYRKARIVNNEYFDSVSYGILREECEK